MMRIYKMTVVVLWLPRAQSMPVCPGLQMQSPVTWSQLLFSLQRQSCRHANPYLPGGHAVSTCTNNNVSVCPKLRFSSLEGDTKWIQMKFGA